METDLKKIKKIAKRKEDENWKFRSFLKGCESKQVDGIVHRLHKEVSKHVDCTSCANCCKESRPLLKKGDIKRLSKALNMAPKKFIEEFTAKDEDGDNIFKQLPCPLLKENKCTQYKARPVDCISFPHLHKKDFVFRLMGVVHNYDLCPIVFNVYEELKKELRSNFKEFLRDMKHFF